MKKIIVFLICIINIFAFNSSKDATVSEFLIKLAKETNREDFFEIFEDKKVVTFANETFKKSENKQLFNNEIFKKNYNSLNPNDFDKTSSSILEYKGDFYSIFYTRSDSEKLSVFQDDKKISDILISKYLGIYSKENIMGYTILSAYGSDFKADSTLIKNMSQDKIRDKNYSNQVNDYFDINNDGIKEFLNYNKSNLIYQFFREENSQQLTKLNFDVLQVSKNSFLDFVTQNEKNYVVKYRKNWVSDDITIAEIFYIKTSRVSLIDTLFISQNNSDVIFGFNSELVEGSIFKALQNKDIATFHQGMLNNIKNNTLLLSFLSYSYNNLQKYDYAINTFDKIILFNSSKYDTVTAKVYKAITLQILNRTKEAKQIKKELLILEKEDPNSIMGGFPALEENEMAIYNSL